MYADDNFNEQVGLDKENADINVASCSYKQQQVPLAKSVASVATVPTNTRAAAATSLAKTVASVVAKPTNTEAAQPQAPGGSRMVRARELHIEQSVVLQQETNVLLRNLISVLEDMRDISQQRLEVAQKQLQFGNVVVQYPSGEQQ